MSNEYQILYFIWLITFGLLLFIPKDKIRIAQTAFLFKQVVTLFIGLIVVELGWIEYPIRFFENEIRSSFIYEFFALPITCALFNVWYPYKKSKRYKMAYLFLLPTILTIPEIIIEKQTELINYVHWTWFTSWISIFGTFYLSRCFIVWFFPSQK